MPKILMFLRRDDNAIFSLNEDKTTFSHHDHKVQFPSSLCHKFSKEYLLSLNFIPLVELESYTRPVNLISNERPY